jgi:hypothetical protein
MAESFTHSAERLTAETMPGDDCEVTVIHVWKRHHSCPRLHQGQTPAAPARGRVRVKLTPSPG